MELVTLDTKNHAVLRKRATEITFPLDDKTKQIIQDLKHFFAILESPFGKPAGLALPQVGLSLRIIIIQVPEEAKKIRKDVFDSLPPTVLINPSYTLLSEHQNKDWEGCFSVPNRMGEIYRYSDIQYEGWTEEGKLIRSAAKGFLARLIQHEVAHLNGELYIDMHHPDCRIGPYAEMLAIRKEEMNH